MKSFVYVDNSNVFIEGQRVAAVRSGKAMNVYDAIERNIFDFTYQIDYGHLHEYLCGQNKSEIGCANLWGSPPPSDSFWQMVEGKGFKVQTYDRNFSGKEKKVDVAIAHSITKDAYTIIRDDRENSEIVLVAGDRDYVPVLDDLVNNGYNITVVFWAHAASELKEKASKFICLDDCFDFIRLTLPVSNIRT